MPRYQVMQGDCREVLKTLTDSSVDSVVTDPPYELGFMGKGWDRSGIAYDIEVWRECLRVLKPGAHLLAFGGSRTYHRLACAIEDAGFEIRDDIDFWYDANPIFAAFYDSLSDEQKEMLHASAGAPHLSWIYGSGFPKSLDVSKAIDAAAGAEREVVGSPQRPDGSSRNPALGGGGGMSLCGSRDGSINTNGSMGVLTAPVTDAAKQWDGWGTALKPAHEPIVLARKPLIGTVAENVLQHGTGGLNIDGCRIETDGRPLRILDAKETANNVYEGRVEGDPRFMGGSKAMGETTLGRWPSNVCHDGSEEVLAGFPETGGGGIPQQRERTTSLINLATHRPEYQAFDDTLNGGGSAARFFYCAKASKGDREDGLDSLPLRSAGEVTDREDGSDGLNSPRAGAGRTNGSRNHHPTVKPTELTRYLCRLITPPKGTILDPFCGSGSTGRGAMIEKFNFIGIDLSTEYCEIAKLRIEAAIELQGSLFDQD